MGFKLRAASKIPTPDDLAKAALRYLARYAASEAALRKTLQNRLRRTSMLNAAFADDKEMQGKLMAVIEDVIARHKKSGVLNDAAFAETKISSLRRAGKSAYVIKQKLGLKGVDAGTIKKALEQNDDGADPEETERKAALAFAKRRRLGMFRSGKAVENQGRKDLAALARAGFSIDLARKILGTAADEFDES